MTDFWLTKNNRACDFVADIDSVVAASPPGSWRLDKHWGTLFPTDYRLLITKKSTTSGTLQVINPVLKRITFEIDIALWSAPTGTHKGVGHFFMSADETIFLFKYTHPTKGSGVLAQRYFENGAHWKYRPTTLNALSYSAPLVNIAFARTIKTDGPILERPTPTQDDEGGGYVP